MSESGNQSLIEVTREQDVLDGVVICIDGTGSMMQVHVQEGDAVHRCIATQEIGKALAPYLFDTILRVNGISQWQRQADGTWLMKQFVIHDFEEIDDTPLREVVDRLREIKGSGWEEIEDLEEELWRIRHIY